MNKITPGLLILVAIFILGCHPEQRLIQERRAAIDLYGKALKLESEANYQLALEYLLKAAELSPRPAIYYHIGHCYRMLGEKERAAQYLRLALKDAPDYKRAEMELKEVELTLASETPEIPASEPLLAQTRENSQNRDKLIHDQPEPVRNSPESELAETKTDQEKTITPSRKIATKKNVGPSNPVPLSSPKYPENSSEKEKPSISNPRKPESASKPTREEIRKVLFPKLYGKHPAVTEKETFDYMKGRSLLDDPVEYHYQKGKYYMERKLWQEAISEFREALRYDEKHLDSLIQLAEAYIQYRQPDKAENCFEQGVRYYPDNPDVLFKFSVFCLERKDYDRAISLLDRLKTIQPHNPKVFNNLGVAWLRKENFVLAEENFKLAVSKDPAFAKGYYNLGILYDRYLKQPENALRMYKKYIETGGEKKELVEKWIRELENNLKR